MKFGDELRYQIDRDVGHGLFIARMAYGADVVMIATEQHFGMPIAERWCAPTGKSDPVLAQRLLERYEARFPGRLIPCDTGAQEAPPESSKDEPQR